MADVANDMRIVGAPARGSGMEVTVDKRQFRKLATVGAAGALALQLFAGTTTAAVPNAEATSGAYGGWASDGWAGFWTTFSYQDTSTLAKLYLEVDITGGEGIPYVAVTKNGAPVAGNACSVNLATDTTPLNLKCTFKTVRFDDDFHVDLGVDPMADATQVAATPLWSSTGFTQSDGGNTSHGDTWPAVEKTDYNQKLGDGNVAAGFGNASLNTSTVDLGGNGQAASLKSLPNGKYAFVNDDAGDGGDFPLVSIDVNGGEPAMFQVLIVYPKGTGVPKSYVHDTHPEPYYICQKGKPTIDCFTWSNKTNTATLYLSHNGTLRRAG